MYPCKQERVSLVAIVYKNLNYMKTKEILKKIDFREITKLVH